MIDRPPRPRVVLAASPAERPLIATWLTNDGGCDVVAGIGTADEALRAAHERTPDLVITHAALEAGTGLELVEQLWARLPSVGAVVLAPGTASVDGSPIPDLELERRALRAGAVEVLALPLGPDSAAALHLAIAQVSRRRALLAKTDAAQQVEALRRQAAATGGNVIAVVSAKGGVGRSFVAANLASLFAEREPAALCDLDLQFGDISTWGSDGTQLDRSIDQLVAVVSAGELTKDDVLAVSISRFGKVTLLPGTHSPIEGATWAADRGARSQRLVRALRGWFGWVVVDGLPGLLEPVVGIARAASATVVVSGCDVGSLRATRRYLDLLDRYAPVPRVVVANRADRGEPRRVVTAALGPRERVVFVKEDRTFARRLVVEGLAAPQQRGRGVSRSLRSVADHVRRGLAEAT